MAVFIQLGIEIRPSSLNHSNSSFLSFLFCFLCFSKENSNPVEQIRRVFSDNISDTFAYFSIKTYIVGTH